VFALQEEATLRNTEAAKQLAAITRTSLGPNGMNKLVVNHLEKLFVTSDAATIVQELEVAHPAARMLVLAAKMQEQEVRAAPARLPPPSTARAASAAPLPTLLCITWTPRPCVPSCRACRSATAPTSW